MISRRQLIGSGVALSALGVGVCMADATQTPASAPARIALLTVDERFEGARALARAIPAPGARYLVMPRDVLDLWHRHLESVSRTGKVAFAGVTTERGLFLLHTLAADHRLRLRSRVDHGALVSWVIGPK